MSKINPDWESLECLIEKWATDNGVRNTDHFAQQVVMDAKLHNIPYDRSKADLEEYEDD